MAETKPEKNIDWKIVDKLLLAGCLATEIAAYIGVCRETLYRRCIKDNGIGYSTYSQEKKAKGESLLRNKQFETAMEGNVTMQIWLGKQRMGQREKHDVNVKADCSDFDNWRKMQEQEQENSDQAGVCD